MHVECGSYGTDDVLIEGRHAYDRRAPGVSATRQTLLGSHLHGGSTTKEHWSLSATAPGSSELRDATMPLVLWMQYQHTAGVALGSNQLHAGGLPQSTSAISIRSASSSSSYMPMR